MRRPPAAWTALVLLLSWLAIGPALAQSPEAGAAQKAARDFLALTDRGDSASAQRAAGEKFRSAMTAEQWAQALRSVREPLGAATQRTLAATRFTKSFPGVGDGEYALLHFRTTFAKKAGARETVTLERESDGTWRVIGYAIE